MLALMMQKERGLHRTIQTEVIPVMIMSAPKTMFVTRSRVRAIVS